MGKIQLRNQKDVEDILFSESEPEESDNPGGIGERPFGITVHRFAGSHHEIKADNDEEVKA